MKKKADKRTLMDKNKAIDERSNPLTYSYDFYNL